MSKINKDITLFDKFIILLMIFIKLVRGTLKKITIKSSGMLFIGSHTRITHRHYMRFGKNTKVESYAEIQGLSKKGIVFGDNVTIGRNCQIRPSSYYGTGNIGLGLKIGDNSSVGPDGYIGCSGLITIGKNVMIGPKVSLFAENHKFYSTKRTIKSQGVENLGITIEDDCWIGSGVIILDGVTIGCGSVIAAGALISKNVPSQSIVIDKRNKLIVKRQKNRR